MKTQMTRLKEFFDAERKRVFLPGPFFTERVMARWNEYRSRDFSIWDMIPNASRMVLAMALMLIFCFIAIELLVPHLPVNGMVESYVEAEMSPTETSLYSAAEVPAGGELLEQLITLEDLR